MNSKTNYFGIATVYDMTRVAIVTALYVVITMVFASLSYGPVQFRVAELLNLLALYNKRYVVAVALGVGISNALGPLGPIDVIWGALSTFVTMLILYYVAQHIRTYANKLVAGVVIVTLSMVTIAAELPIVLHMSFWGTFWMNWLTVGAGELVVLVAGAMFFWILNQQVNLHRILD
ncbi:QueT transporter family protein [Secundilactobacillus kimchicus]|uniref:QueT transporter family protein n=1 Tax=Secundilactobacillus kimchicus TaxID=528209 RepID=UPI0024A8856B|nr:QueT transporter family protein [Secundilactobacillus kimchicus]